MALSGKSTVVGVFGDPVAHSLSPRMHNTALEAAGLDAVYVPFHVKGTQLCDAVSGLRALGIRGVNLTIPHKEKACALVDELDDHAVLVGAINTIVNSDGHLKGYNTDGPGLLSALKQDLSVDVEGRRVLILGAGGACRAAVVSLCQARAAWVGIANRTRSRSQSLLDELSVNFSGTTFAEYELSATALHESIEPVDLLINTSSVGLKGGGFDFDPTVCVKESGAVFDMVYAEEPTQLICQAREKGLKAADGLGMLAAQGEEAFRLWFGCDPQPQVMYNALTLSSAVKNR